MIAFVFPGQGSQFPGMGKSLADAFPQAAQVFETADQALGFSLSKLCFEGPEDTLRLTENTQPAMVAVSIAALQALKTELVLRIKDAAANRDAGHPQTVTDTYYTDRWWWGA